MANLLPLSGPSVYPRFIWPYSTAPHNGYTGAEGGSPANDGVNDNANHGFGPGVGRNSGGSTGVAGGGPTPGVQKFGFTYVPR